MSDYSTSPIEIRDSVSAIDLSTMERDPLRFAMISIVGTSLTSEAGVRAAVAKLTAWLDAPRLAARGKAEAVASTIDYALVATTAGEWGVTWRDNEDDPADGETEWFASEDLARSDFREATGTSRCELCGTYRDDHDVDEDGIYTCTAEHKTACEAACAKKGPTP